MKIPLSFTIVAAVCLSQGGLAQSADGLAAEGIRAVEQGIPAAAVGKFRLALDAATDPAGKERCALLLAHALLRTNRPDDALQAVREINGTAADRVRGLVYARKGMWARALPFLEAPVSAADGTVEQQREILLAHAEALRGLGRLPEALDVLREPQGDPVLLLQRAELQLDAGNIDAAKADLAAASKLPGSGGQVGLFARFLTGRLLIANKHYADAITELEDLSRSPLPDVVGVGTVIALSEARRAVGTAEAADDVLEEFISKHSSSCFLDRVFARLDALYDEQDNPSESALYKWAKDDPPERAALAQFYLAKAELREKKSDRALRRLTAFTIDHPTHPAAAKANLIRARLLADEGKFEDALAACEQAMRAALTPDQLGEAEIEAGLLHFREGEFLLSVNLFHSAAQHSQRLRERALYNSAMSWLNQGNYEKFQEDYRLLSEYTPDSNLRGALLLEEGLQQARTHSEQAPATLVTFLKQFPRHPRLNEAKIALAEMRFLNGGSDSPDGSDYLRVVNEIVPGQEAADRAQLLKIFVAESAAKGDNSEVVRLAQDLLAKFPESPLRDQARMKLGQALFRSEDYASAQTQFELLARSDSESPLAESALFLAGQSAVRTLNAESLNRALELFSEVAKRGGSYRLAAREQQAIIQARLDHHEEAIVIYDNILSSAPDADLRCSAMLGKGDSLFVLGGTDPKRYEQALAVYQELSKTADISPECRNQALFKQAQCLTKLGRDELAVVPLYDVVDAQLAPGQPAEYFWFYKAGFEAGQRLESKQDWKSAVGIYQRIASLEGPRAAEARERANHLRLEHFLWEE